MALSLRIQKTSIDSDGGAITITDVTGAYNASDNQGGYGTPNPLRTDIALFLHAYQKRYNKTDTLVSTALIVTPNDPDKRIVSNWKVALTGVDCWVQSTVYGLKLWQTGTSVIIFQTNELTYDTVTGEIRKITGVSPSAPYDYTYVVVDETALEDETSVIIYETVYNTYAIPNSCECHYQSLKVWNSTKAEEDFNNYLEIDALLKAVKYNFGFGAFSEGQKVIEEIEDKCGCLNDCNC